MKYLTKAVREPQERLDFLELPYNLYRNNSSWVPPLRSEVAHALDADNNPYFRGVALEKFVCYRDNEPAARAVAVINPRHWEKFGQKTAFFGFFESINDVVAVHSLFAAVETFCAQHGAEYLEGPFNPNHYSELGLLVDNFDVPVFFEPYNPPYYAKLLLMAGMEPMTRLHTRIIADETKAATIAKRLDMVEHARKAGYTLRSFRLWNMRKDLEILRSVYNDAFENNWHFLPLTSEEYAYTAKSMFLVTNPSLVKIVEFKGEPVGALQFVFDVNPMLARMKGEMGLKGIWHFLRHRFMLRDVVLYASGIKKAFRNTPAIELIIWAVADVAQRYRKVYSTWMMDSNIAAVKASERVGFEPYKWFEIVGKKIQIPTP